MKQGEVLSLILLWIGSIASIEMFVAFVSVMYLNRKTEEKRQERLAHERKDGQSRSLGIGAF